MLLGFRLRPQSSISPTRERRHEFRCRLGAPANAKVARSVHICRAVELPFARACERTSLNSATIQDRLRGAGYNDGSMVLATRCSFAKVEGKGLP